jgi:hypothetical protein
MTARQIIEDMGFPQNRKSNFIVKKELLGYPRSSLIVHLLEIVRSVGAAPTGFIPDSPPLVLLRCSAKHNVFVTCILAKCHRA